MVHPVEPLHSNRRRRVLIGAVVALMLVSTGAILAQHRKTAEVQRSKTAEQLQTASQVTGEMTPQSFSPSLGSKDYIYLGGKVVATEERVTFTDVADGSDFYEDIYRIAAR